MISAAAVRSFWTVDPQSGRVASAENPGDGPEDVLPKAFCGHPAVGPSDSLLQLPPGEQQVMRSRPSQLRLQSSHAEDVDVAMQRRCNLSLAVCFFKEQSVHVPLHR